MPAASPGIYQALGMHLETTLVLPELIQAAPSVKREALVQVVEADHRDWPTLEASPTARQRCSWRRRNGVWNLKALAGFVPQAVSVWNGFAEKPAGCERFFRSGRTGEGVEQLPIEQRKRLAMELAEAMNRFEYEGPELD